MSLICKRKTIYVIAAVLGDILLIAFLRYVWHLSLFDVFLFLGFILLNGVAIYVDCWISLEHPTLVLAGILGIPFACIHLFLGRIETLGGLWGGIKILPKIGHILVLTFLMVYFAFWLFLTFCYFYYLWDNTLWGKL